MADDPPGPDRPAPSGGAGDNAAGPGVPATAATAPAAGPEPMSARSGQARGVRRTGIHLGSPFRFGFVGALGVLAAWALANMVVSARSVLVLVVIALYLAVGLNPLVTALVRRGMRRGLAVLAIFLLLLAFFGLLALAVVPVVTDQINSLIGHAPDWLEQLRTNRQIQEFDDRYHLIERAQDYITGGSLAERLFGGLLGVGRVVLSAVFSAFTVLVLTVYFLGSLPAIKRAAFQLVPRSRRDRVVELSDEVLDRIGSYVAGQILVAAIAGSASYVFLMIVGLRSYALALAIVVAICGLIPLIGGVIGAVIISAIGFVTGVGTGIACLVYYVVYQQLENYVIYPRIMQRSVSVPGTVVVVAAMLGGSLFGLVGALLAVPMAASILLLLRELVVPRAERA